LVNSFTAVLADKDESYASALADERAVLLPDGTPLVWLARLSRGSDVEGVRGPTLMRRALLAGGVTGRRHFLLGSTDENLSRLAEKVEATAHGNVLCGYYSPPFGPLDETEWARIVRMVKDSDADVVWVGLGTPLQDFVSVRLARETSASVVAVGAAFDFLAGTKKEAPRWLHGTGLEWIHRLATEPKRLWRRYLVGNAQFMRLAVRRSLSSRTRNVPQS
jgi:N-acetylglucosaminyldiphosphoundecaprenol N-acetyl-beta-D-mannosaminyltransferase